MDNPTVLVVETRRKGLGLIPLCRRLLIPFCHEGDNVIRMECVTVDRTSVLEITINGRTEKHTMRRGESVAIRLE